MPFAGRHPGQAVDQVDRDVPESRRLRLPHRFDGPAGVVAAVHPPQMVVAERLDADAEPVDTGFAQSVEVSGRQVVRVGFERNLFERIRPPAFPHLPHEPSDLFGGTYRRGPAAEVKGFHAPAPDFRPSPVDFAADGVEHPVLAGQRRDVVEIAVSADLPTKGIWMYIPDIRYRLQAGLPPSARRPVPFHTGTAASRRKRQSVRTSGVRPIPI